MYKKINQIYQKNEITSFIPFSWIKLNASHDGDLIPIAIKRKNMI